MESLNYQFSPENTRGRDVIEEAAALLRSVRFSAYHGSHAFGKQVAVRIGVEYNEHNKTLNALITCYAFGHRTVDWEGILLFIIPAGGTTQRVVAVSRLDRRGQAFISNQPVGKYQIITSATCGRSHNSVPPYLPGSWYRPYWSKDKRVKLEVRQSKSGLYQIVAKTSDTSLVGGTIIHALVEEQTGKVYASGQVELEHSHNLRSEGWTQPARLAADFQLPLRLVFCSVPSNEQMRRNIKWV